MVNNDDHGKQLWLNYSSLANFKSRYKLYLDLCYYGTHIQELEIAVTHPGEEEESDDEQKNVAPPAYSDKLGRFAGESQTSSYKSTGMKATSSSLRASGGQRVSVDSYEEMPGDLGGGVATRTVSYKKTTSFKKVIEVPESTETVTVTHMTSPIETDDDKAGLLNDDQMVTFNFDD